MTEKTQSHNDPALDEQLTQLVSYLDGELDVTQMTEVERDLVNDSAMRSHADILSKTWALLDDLDDVPASEMFTQQTMSTIASQSITEQPVAAPGRLWLALKTVVVRYKIVPAFFIGLFGGSLGLFAIGVIQQQAIEADRAESAVDRLIVENIDILPDAGLYEVVPSAETLKALQLAGPSGLVSGSQGPNSQAGTE